MANSVTGLAWEIAGFVKRLTFDDLTPARQARIAMCYMDFLALAAAASDLPEAQVATVLAEPGRVHLPGIGAGSVSPASAIVSLGYVGALLQLHDGFGQGGNHPSSALVPTAYALGQSHQLTEVLAALAAGYEVANRLAAATHPAQSIRGSAPTGTMGAVGAAAIAARLMGLDRAATAEALSIAAILAPVAAYEALRIHGSAVPFHGGYAGRAGYDAARLAAAGLEGGATVLEGRPGAAGFLEFLRGSPADLAAPETWAGQTLDMVYFKAVPGCRHLQPAWEALAQIIDRAGPAQGIARVRVETYPLALAFALRPDVRYALYDRLMSLPWAMAAALLYGGLSVDTARTPPDATALDALIDRIDVVEAADITARYPGTLGARVTLSFTDGRDSLTGHAALLYGEEPRKEALTPAGGTFPALSRAELIARDAGFLAPVWSGAEAALIDQTRQIVLATPPALSERT